VKRRLFLSGILGFGLLAAASGSSLAQSVEKQKTPAANQAEMDAQDEAAALKFADEHHPELSKLLAPMKSARPKEYQKAIREISRASERLARFETRAPERYAIEIELWKAESRLRLVAARTAMGDDDERREQIEKLVTARNALKLRLYQLERDEAQARIANLDAQIEALKSQEPEAVRQEVDRLVKTAKSSAKRVRTKLEKGGRLDSPASENAKPANPKRAPGAAGASQ